jgi:hypothetical protein
MREGVANIAFARSHSEGASERFSSQFWKLASVMAGILRRVRHVWDRNFSDRPHWIGNALSLRGLDVERRAQNWPVLAGAKGA